MKIYIVQGIYGDHIDHKEWVVCAYLDHEAARKKILELEKWSRVSTDIARRLFDSEDDFTEDKLNEFKKFILNKKGADKLYVDNFDASNAFFCPPLYFLTTTVLVDLCDSETTIK